MEIMYGFIPSTSKVVLIAIFVNGLVEVGSFSILECAAHCVKNPSCMSLAYSKSGGSCRLSYHRVHDNRQTNPDKVDNGSQWTVGYKKGYLEGWTLLKDAYYLFIQRKKGYMNAKENCRKEGGKLAEPRTRSTNKVIKAYIGKKGVFGRYWIGMNDIAKDRHFVWESTGETPKFTDWTGRGPSHYYRNMKEDFVEILKYGWNDAPCFKGKFSICELQ